MASSDSAAQSPVVEFLRRGESYPDRPEHVETIETHLSYVFLAESRAYKLKKPVRFEFVDFSTIAARHAACDDELRLNRRLAESVYQCVLPITTDATGNLAIDGAGTPVDWVVRMRRFNEDQTLEAAIRNGTVVDHQLDALCDLLLAFYRRAEPEKISPNQFRAQIERHVRANLADLRRAEHEPMSRQVQRIHAGQLRMLMLAPGVFDARVEAGRIIEGHGDLRPEHIVLESPPVVIDCLEFSRELRVLDVLDELCFLAMECARLGDATSGKRVLDRYQQATGDDPPTALIAFYQSYRACVRAKVAALRGAQLSGLDREAARVLVERYLGLADGLRGELGPPTLIVVSGLSGTGKSTLAAALAEKLAAVHLQTDVVRREIFGPSDASQGDDDRYLAANRDKVYETMFARAHSSLADGIPVVLDGTFLKTQFCVAAMDVAKQTGAVSLVVQCVCPASVATERIAARLAGGNSVSEAQPDLHHEQQANQEALPSEIPSAQIDTTSPLEDQVAAVCAQLAALLFPRRG